MCMETLGACRGWYGGDPLRRMGQLSEELAIGRQLFEKLAFVKTRTG